MMNSSRVIRTVLWGGLVVVLFCSLRMSVEGAPSVGDDKGVLPGTEPLTMQGDIASQLVDGVDRFLLRKLLESKPGPETVTRFQNRGPQRVPEMRRKLARKLGVRESRMSFEAPELLGGVNGSGPVVKGERYEVYRVRWPVLADPALPKLPSITGEGLLLTPTGNQPPVADVIAIPDADQTPESLVEFSGDKTNAPMAVRLAEQGCRVLVPMLINRQMQQRGGARLTHREYLYRPGFELGHPLVGYEVQKILAGVDWFEKSQGDKKRKIGVAGYGEAGMLALYAAAIDTRIGATLVSGYFEDRTQIWKQPIDRNVFGLLNEFSDAELGVMIAQRGLVIESGTGPKVSLPGKGGAPAELNPTNIEAAKAEIDRCRLLAKTAGVPTDRLIHTSTVPEKFCGDESLLALLRLLDVRLVDGRLRNAERHSVAGLSDPSQMNRQIEEIDRHNQRLLSESATVRAEFMKGLDTKSVAAYEKSVERYREIFRNDVIGQFDEKLLPANPRTRRIYDKEKWTGYEVVLDVFPDVIAYGVLLLPNDLKPGERRPVVVCQHGLEGRPKDTIEGNNKYYHDFAAKLAERGFITFAPQNLYIFKDRFRTLQRKANPLGKSLFSIIVPQHQQITDWLKTLPYVDADHIGFYGLSYGGKSAMRIPPLVKNYCLSICSADFNEWVWKNSSSRASYSYVLNNEYEIFEFDLGSTFNYAEMAALIAPRPFMVERGHFDTVGPDEQVAFEFAKVRNLYAARLGIGDRCEIEFFVGPHTINGKGTFEFLHKHLKWEKRGNAGSKEGTDRTDGTNRTNETNRTGVNTGSVKGPVGPGVSPHPVSEAGPLPPVKALRALRTLPDLEVQQVLAEPVVSQPVFLNFDERGRMWVVQFLQYPQPAGLKVLSHDIHWRAVYDKVPQPPPHHVRGADKITIHEDTDGDGVYDKHKTFVEGLNICTAVCRGRGGAWVLNPPYLLFYPDRNNDDVPDGDPEVRLAGFGLEDTHSTVNSLCWGPDGWLYAAQGSTVSGDVSRPGLDKVPVHSLGQLIWRYHPEKKLYEIFSEGGGNAYGCEIDSKGRIFSGHNGGNTRGFHYLQGAYLQKGFQKHGPLSNPFSFGYFPAMEHPAVPRFTHCFCLYEATALPKSHRGKLFGVAPLLNYVVESEMTPRGSTFKTRDVAFPILSDDPWFRPVDIKLGPEGAIYVADWYDNQVAHLRSAEGQFDKEHGRIYRIHARGAAASRPEDLGQLSTTELLQRLRDENRWVRQTALRLIGDRRDRSVIPALRKELANHIAGQLSLESLWALHLSGGLDEQAVLEALDHPDPFVRLWAVRLEGDDRHVSAVVAKRMAELARTEPNVEVRSQLACSAKRLPAAEALPIVRNLLAHNEDLQDPRMPLLNWWALEAHCATQADDVLKLFAGQQVWHLPQVDELVVSRLMQRFAAAGTRRDLLTCARLLRMSPSPASTRRLMLGFEEAFKGRSLTNLPLELVEALAAAGGGSLSLRIRQQDPQALHEGARAMLNAALPSNQRLELVKLFGEVREKEALKPLLQIAGSRAAAVELRQAAVNSLQAYDDPQVPATLLSEPDGSPDELRQTALAVLVSRPAWTKLLLKSVAAGQVSAENVPVETVRKMLLRPDAEIEAAVRQHWGTVEGATTDVMRRQVSRLAGVIRGGNGDPYAGKALFQQTCAKCHRLFSEGGEVGPDLTSYKRDDIERMLLNVVNPSAEIREGFENYALLTKDGRTLIGFLADQDNQVVLLRSAEGQTQTVPRSNIDELRRVSLSLMPEGTLNALKDQQVCDLFAYLRATQPLLPKK